MRLPASKCIEHTWQGSEQIKISICIEKDITRSGYNIEQGKGRARDKARDKAGECTTGVDQTGELDQKNTGFKQ